MNPCCSLFSLCDLFPVFARDGTLSFSPSPHICKPKKIVNIHCFVTTLSSPDRLFGFHFIFIARDWNLLDTYLLFPARTVDYSFVFTLVRGWRMVPVPLVRVRKPHSVFSDCILGLRSHEPPMPRTSHHTTPGMMRPERRDWRLPEHQNKCHQYQTRAKMAMAGVRSV